MKDWFFVIIKNGYNQLIGMIPNFVQIFNRIMRFYVGINKCNLKKYLSFTQNYLPSKNGIIDLKTLHFRHIFIFSVQSFLASPSHIVPLINQQSCPTFNSHAGQFCLVDIGHFLITQHGLLFLFRASSAARRNNTCLSI